MKLVEFLRKRDGTPINVNPIHVESIEKGDRTGESTLLVFASGRKFRVRGDREEVKGKLLGSMVASESRERGYG